MYVDLEACLFRFARCLLPLLPWTKTVKNLNGEASKSTSTCVVYLSLFEEVLKVLKVLEGMIIYLVF